MSVRFPEVTVGPGSNPAKRLLMLSASSHGSRYPVRRDRSRRRHPLARRRRALGESEPRSIRQRRYGGHARRASEQRRSGHRFQRRARRDCFAARTGAITGSACRSSRSTRRDRRIAAAFAKRRTIRRPLWVSAGPNFQSDLGVLFRSRDGGANWERVEMGIQPKSTMVGLTLDEHEPARMYCATRGGEVFGSRDQGATWSAYPRRRARRRPTRLLVPERS